MWCSAIFSHSSLRKGFKKTENFEQNVVLLLFLFTLDTHNFLRHLVKKLSWHRFVENACASLTMEAEFRHDPETGIMYDHQYSKKLNLGTVYSVYYWCTVHAYWEIATKQKTCIIQTCWWHQKEEILCKSQVDKCDPAFWSELDTRLLYFLILLWPIFEGSFGFLTKSDCPVFLY